MSGFDPAQKTRTEKAPNHRTTPVKRNVTCRRFRGEGRNIRLAEIVHQKTADGDLRTYIGKDSKCAEDKIGMFLGAGSGANCLSFIGLAIKKSFLTFYVLPFAILHAKHVGRQTHREIVC